MPAPARRSLRERDQHAIDPTPLPGQTTIDMPDAPQPVPARPEPATAPTAALRAAASPTRTSASAGPGARRLGIYFHPADFTNAKAAYLADWQSRRNRRDLRRLDRSRPGRPRPADPRPARHDRPASAREW